MVQPSSFSVKKSVSVKADLSITSGDRSPDTFSSLSGAISTPWRGNQGHFKGYNGRGSLGGYVACHYWGGQHEGAEVHLSLSLSLLSLLSPLFSLPVGS